MSATLASLLTLAGMVWLFVRDARLNRDASPALWIPVLWLAITGTRFVSQWMELGQPASHNYTEGSPIDAAYFASLIIIGLWVLASRRVRLSEVLRDNHWLAVLMLYGLVSVVWSEDPEIAIKRWIKALGHPIVALIILTDPDPRNALRTVLRRCAFLFMPLSVLFVKYLPEYGRSFDDWTGEGINNGVSLTKNDLGYLCLASGLCFLWNLLTLQRRPNGSRDWGEIGVSTALLVMALWLLGVANSATSVVTTILAIAVLILLGFSGIRRSFGLWVIAIGVTAAVAEVVFGASAAALQALGRNPTLTDRTVVWADVLALQQQQLIGYGFESFWLGQRLDAMWGKWWWRPTQAHNGYIETYLNLGLIGVVLLAMTIFSAYRNVRRSFDHDFELARLRMALLFAVLAFNLTEAAFKGVHFMWTVFYIAAMAIPARTLEPEPSELDQARGPAPWQVR